MKIAHIVSTFPPYKGGIGNACYNQAVELTKSGYDVTVFTPLYNKEDSILSVPLIKVVRINPWLKYGNAAFIPQLLFKLNNFKVIHIHYPFLGIEFIYLLKLIKKNLRIILQYQMDLTGRGWLKVFFTIHRIFILPLVIKFSDTIIVSSWDYLGNSILYKYYKRHPSKFIELPNGVDMNLFKPLPRDNKLQNKYGIKDNEKILIFVGGLDKAHYFKGLEVLFKAIRDIKIGWKSIIVGSGILKNYYQKCAERLEIGQKVIFVGKIADNELVKYYNLGDVFVLPSIDKTEAFGIVLLEAMACGKPVIASDLPGVRTVVRNNIDGLLVKPNDPLDLSNKINYLLVHKDRVNEMGLAGFQKVQQKYTWQKIAKQLETVYLSVQK